MCTCYLFVCFFSDIIRLYITHVLYVQLGHFHLRLHAYFVHLQNDLRVLIATTESKNLISRKGPFHRLTLLNTLKEYNESQVKVAKLYHLLTNSYHTKSCKKSNLSFFFWCLLGASIEWMSCVQPRLTSISKAKRLKILI